MSVSRLMTTPTSNRLSSASATKASQRDIDALLARALRRQRRTRSAVGVPDVAVARHDAALLFPGRRLPPERRVALRVGGVVWPSRRMRTCNNSQSPSPPRRGARAAARDGPDRAHGGRGAALPAAGLARSRAAGGTRRPKVVGGSLEGEPAQWLVAETRLWSAGGDHAGRGGDVAVRGLPFAVGPQVRRPSLPPRRPRAKMTTTAERCHPTVVVIGSLRASWYFQL